MMMKFTFFCFFPYGIHMLTTSLLDSSTSLLRRRCGIPKIPMDIRGRRNLQKSSYIRQSLTKIWMKEGYERTNDVHNTTIVEQLFYLQHQRYSPYHKKKYITDISPSEHGNIERIRVEVIYSPISEVSEIQSIGDTTQDGWYPRHDVGGAKLQKPLVLHKQWIEDLYQQFYKLSDTNMDIPTQEEITLRKYLQQLFETLGGMREEQNSGANNRSEVTLVHPSSSSSTSSSTSSSDRKQTNVWKSSMYPSSYPKSFPSKKPNEFDTGSQFHLVSPGTYTFQHIGGYTSIKTELLQIADMFLHPEIYQPYHVRIPKGMIFEGPPGNGKTLLAKCFCGEINVSFISVCGSEFSEKYVGVGASRIRELFQFAKEHRPTIIFIDEIDALARSRGNDLVTSNSEKDQTLNQLLTNLDGFHESSDIFVIGATNRIDLLDTALLRPGRMDKHIYIGNPNKETRKAIINIHQQGKPLCDNITMEHIVDMTMGFSGAQIENLLNEAMLRALREQRTKIHSDDLEHISHRILVGWKTTESNYTETMLHRIIIHELGHAIVGMFTQEHAKVKKVCLNLWSSHTPGYTLFESSEESIPIYTKIGMMERLMILLSGRVAEELFFGNSVTTGAQQDLEEAFYIAQQMITKYGFGKQYIYSERSDMSKYIIDQEIHDILVYAQEQALIILQDCQALIMECSYLLNTSHVLYPTQILELMKTKYPMLMNHYLMHTYQIL
jgi:cell division protease FtsH